MVFAVIITNKKFKYILFLEEVKMIVALSYVIAVVLTLALAVCLYPVSGLFWVLGLLGKISDNLFSFTNRVIKSLWKDLRQSEKQSAEQWLCECGTMNSGKFCTECGKSNSVEKTPEISE